MTPEALAEFTSNPAVLASGRNLLRAFPDLRADLRWIVADGDMVVVFHDVRGTQQGPWLLVTEPTERHVETSFMLAFRFDDEGQIVDQWLGSNFVDARSARLGLCARWRTSVATELKPVRLTELSADCTEN